jgi:NAD(P)-dependent dehydrogenase (short-subunit alcohol dehydrogenase family)
MIFSTELIPNLTGKIAVITGANTGIGKITALEFARKGATVIMACRSKDRTLPVVEEIKKATENEKVEFEELDLCSLQSVKDCAKRLQQKLSVIDILVNNAGVMMIPKFETTKDGIEMQFGTNHIGHYYLTRLLLPLVKASKEGRIVNVSSLAHTGADEKKFDFEKINDPAAYGSYSQYAISKGANILFTKALARRLKDSPNIYVNAIHPGVVATELGRYMVSPWLMSLLSPIMSLFLLSPEKGALTQMYAATSEDIVKQGYKGRYFIPYGDEEKPKEYTDNEKLQEDLWEYSEKLVIEKLGKNAFK